MGKTRDLFKKIRDTKGTFHAKMGSIKDMQLRGCEGQEPEMGDLGRILGEGTGCKEL